jgi:hypothetical protein
MATRLYPRHGSQNVDRNSIKIKIDCKNRIASNPESNETKDWLELLSKFKHDSANVKVYKALLDKSKNIVAKIGKYKLDYEYEVAKKLEILKIPTFIKFHCLFSCLDNFSELKNTTKTVCKKIGDPISIIIMPYIEGDRIELWKWERNNFELMKNTMKHVIMSMFYANKTKGFIHGDLHLGNVLLKKSKCKEISYGEFGTLEVTGLTPVIMDFDKSTFTETDKYSLYHDLDRFIGLMSLNCNVKFYYNEIETFLDKNLRPLNSEINSVICNKLCGYIDKLEIRRVDSEPRSMPNWLKPQKV